MLETMLPSLSANDILSMDESPTGGRNLRMFSASIAAYLSMDESPTGGRNESVLRESSVSRLSMDESPTGGRNKIVPVRQGILNLSMDESPTGGRNERTSPLLLLTIILIAPLEGAPGAIRHTARVPCTLPPLSPPHLCYNDVKVGGGR